MKCPRCGYEMKSHGSFKHYCFECEEVNVIASLHGFSKKVYILKTRSNSIDLKQQLLDLKNEIKVIIDGTI